MLTALSIRDVVLIERLDLAFGAGLTVLTGETGAGKSILLDSLGLALGAAKAAIAEAERDEAWLRHAVDELAGLAPQEDEEERLAHERQRLQQGERRAEAIATALAELAPRDRRTPAPAAALRAAGRA